MRNVMRIALVVAVSFAVPLLIVLAAGSILEIGRWVGVCPGGCP